MPPRDPNMPEGTDSIIDGTSELGGSTDGLGTTSGLDEDFMGGTSGGGASLSGGGMGGSSGLSSGTDYSDTSGGSAMASFGAGDLGSGTQSAGTVGGAISQGSGVQSLKAQASDKVRDVASQGKDRATEALTNVTQLINDTAQTIDERLGSPYGDYVRQAATAVEGFGNSIQNKEVDELFDDARNLVRKSPGIALGAAAAVGFLLVRLVKSGMPANNPNDDYDSTGGYAGGTTRNLARPPRVDNSYDPIA